jgi:hypothetical protein
MSVLASMVQAAQAAADIRDIRGPIVDPPSHAIWPWLLAGFGLIAVVTAMLLVRRWRARRRVPADVAALRALEAARPAIEGGDAHAFSTEVSDAVRTYVEAAFALRAPQRTTDELLAELMSDGSPVAAHRAELGTFLGYCDLAKYARWSLSRTDMTGMLTSAETFVRATAGGSS